MRPSARPLDLHEQGLEAPFEEARTRLLYGARLHRARRRADAREHLRAARDLFERLEAAPWVARADAELIAAGATPRPAIGTTTTSPRTNAGSRSPWPRRDEP